MEEQEELHFERIDGVSYEWGSREHERAIDEGIRDRVQRLDAMPFERRLDAAETAFIARDLLYIQRDVQRVLYERLQMPRWVSVRNTVPAGATEWAYRQMKIAGEARVGHLGADDAPVADLSVEEFPFPVVPVQEGYSYTIREMQHAAQARIPLVRDKAMACVEIMARKIDELLRVGNDAAGITGFLNNAFVPVHTVTTGAWTGGATTPKQIVADVAGGSSAIVTQSGDNHEGRRLLLPTAYDAHVSLVTMENTDVSIKKYIRENSEIKEIERYVSLDSATGPSGVTDPPYGILYDPAEENVYAEVPVPYAELPAQARNYAWVVPAYALVGGTVFKRPLSAAYLEALD